MTLQLRQRWSGIKNVLSDLGACRAIFITISLAISISVYVLGYVIGYFFWFLTKSLVGHWPELAGSDGARTQFGA